jgi:hypothetical protein
MKKTICIIFCTILISTTTCVSGAINIFSNYDETNISIYEIESYDPLNGGWIEEIDGVTVLHVSGTYYEMGYQHGYLLKDKIEQNHRAVFEFMGPDIYNSFLEWWNSILNCSTPQDYMDEIYGLVDGSGKTFEDVVVFTLGWPYFAFTPNCMEMVAWGPATENGELYHLFSCDLHKFLSIPNSDLYLHDNQVLVVRDPDDGFASVSVQFPGDISCFGGGFNEQGISIAAEGSPSEDFSSFAIYSPIKFRMVLDDASNYFEAIDIVSKYRSGGVICHIGDGNVPAGYVCELTANIVYVGLWDDIIENTHPFWQINHVLRRKNMFINPLTSSTQREFYNPKVYFLLGLKKGVIPWFNPWRYYKTLSEETEKIWGTMNADNILDMAHSIYKGETDLYLRLSWKLGKEKFGSYYQWVACPKTGDIAISFAEGENFAQYGDVHHFNLFDLLNSEPP